MHEILPSDNFRVMLMLPIQQDTGKSKILNLRGVEERKGEGGSMTLEARASCPYQFNQNLWGCILNMALFKKFPQDIQICSWN